MKTFVQNSNRYLLERFPIIWNTRLVWVLIVAAILHLLFFFLGYTTLYNPKNLHEYGAKYIFLDNGSIYINIIISVISIVIWLIYLFKNNAFKNFYPTTSLQLFKQFLCYLIAVFCLSTFFISYQLGLKTYVAQQYPDHKMNKEIQQINDAALFFSQNIHNYTLNNRRYPEPFNKLYCEKNENKTTNNTQKYSLSFLSDEYTFYTLKQKKVAKDSTRYNKDYYTGRLFQVTSDSTVTYYFQDSIYNISTHVKSAYPSYYNYSECFIISKNNNPKWNTSYIEQEYHHFSNLDFYINQNKKNYELLQRNNPEEIKALLAQTLAIANAYKIPHNLTTQAWFKLIYHPEEFTLKHLIRYKDHNTSYWGNYPDEPKQPFEELYQNLATDFYIETKALKHVYANIEAIKADTSITDSIHFYMWGAFLLAALIFMFRITGLKALIFAVITTGVLSLMFVLLFFLVLSLVNNSIHEEYLGLWLALSIVTSVLSIPIGFTKRIKKPIVGVCLNISMVGFIVFMMLFMVLIDTYQTYSCTTYARFVKLEEGWHSCTTIFDVLGIYWSYVLYLVNLIIIYLYMHVVKTWKALPEA